MNHLTIHSSLCRPSLFYSFLLPPFSSASHSNVNVWSGVTLGNLFTPMSVVPFSKAHIPQFLQQYMHQGVFVNVTEIFMKPFLSQSIKWIFSYMGPKVSVVIIHFWWSTHHVCNCCCFFCKCTLKHVLCIYAWQYFINVDTILYYQSFKPGEGGLFCISSLR